MTDYDQFVEAIISHWDVACDFTWKHQSPSGSRSLTVKDYVNFRASKHGVVEAAQKGVSLRPHQIFDMINQAICDGIIVPAHGHYRLNPANTEKFLTQFATTHAGTDIARLMKRANKRTTKVPLGLYASSVGASSAVSPIASADVSPEPISTVPKSPIDRIEAMRRNLGGFTRLWDCLNQQVSLSDVTDMDINETGNLEVTYCDGSSRQVLIASFVNAWDHYDSSAKSAVSSPESEPKHDVVVDPDGPEEPEYPEVEPMDDEPEPEDDEEDDEDPDEDEDEAEAIGVSPPKPIK